MENPSKKRSFDIKKPYKTETFIFPLKKSEAFPPPTCKRPFIINHIYIYYIALISTTKNKPKTTLLLQDSIITSIARENMKNFLHYKMWKKKTSTETLNSPINNIETLPNLQNSLKKTISLKKAPENNHIMTKSLTNLNFKEKNGLAKTFSSSFQRNLDEKERKKQNKGRKMIKLAQIVTKVRNFKLNYPEKGSKTLEALLESVKSLNPSENPFKTLEKIDSPPLKRPLSISSDKKPLKFLHKQRKSLDINLKVLRPEKAIPLLPKTDFLYYMTLLDYFIRNPNDSDYFNLLYREHFLQSLAAYNYCIGLKEKAQKPFFEGKKVFLGPNPRSKNTPFI